VPVSPRRRDASVAVRDHGHVLQLLLVLLEEGQLLVLVFIGVVEGVVGRDIEEVGFLGRIGGEQGSWRDDKENLTYGRKRVFNAAICFSISPKPLCAAAEPGLACLTSMLEAVACQNLVRGLRLSISRFLTEV
jgi:hypothetical protein